MRFFILLSRFSCSLDRVFLSGGIFFTTFSFAEGRNSSRPSSFLYGKCIHPQERKSSLACANAHDSMVKGLSVRKQAG